MGNDTGLDTNSRCDQPPHEERRHVDKVDIVRGLPRSEENHSTNGLDLDETTNTLYVMSGGNANKEALGNNFSGTPEYYLSAALLSVDLDAIDGLARSSTTATVSEVAYDLRTLDDPTRPNIDNMSPDFPYPLGHPLYNVEIDPGDLFGGNNSLNQAIPSRVVRCRSTRPATATPSTWSSPRRVGSTPPTTARTVAGVACR